MLPYKHKLIPRAKELRKNATRQENHLWYDFLRAYPVRFQRQKSIGNYIVDFYCHSARIAVEIDGSQHYEEKASAYDGERTAFLRSQGVQVLRFTNREMDTRFEAVCLEIDKQVNGRMKNEIP